MSRGLLRDHTNLFLLSPASFKVLPFFTKFFLLFRDLFATLQFVYYDGMEHLMKKILKRIMFPLIGFMSLLWFLVRVIPKPSRAAYPCMKAAAPLASGFIVYLAGIAASLFTFKKARMHFHRSGILIGTCLVLLAVSIGTVTFLHTDDPTYAVAVQAVQDPFGPNNPIGQAKGLHPGRVVWVHNEDATNENCVPDKWGDGYFLPKNANQSVIDNMFSEALLALTNETSESAAWDVVFKYFNQQHGKGEVGYQNGETIFIKINSVHAMGARSGVIGNNDSYGNVDTSPQAVLAMLRQLVNKAGVPQSAIYIGDPFAYIFNHCFDMWHAEFPDVHYMDPAGKSGREKLTPGSTYSMYYSDRGTELDEEKDKYYAEMENADYLLNIPAMKGHGLAGMTLFAKNFFGANTRGSAAHLHKGLHSFGAYGEPTRNDYRMYRVLVDNMGHKNLGGKTLIYFADALWACSFEHEPPAKFHMPPFNNDWSSSLFLSQDPVAIESVCLDVLQAEFPKTPEEDGGDGRHWYANFPAADDFLHQAADAANWPEDITYDPENDGTPISSLGVHEHWNNATDMQYSRNLKTGDGIELVKLFDASSEVKSISNSEPSQFRLHPCYPNPFNPATTIRYDLSANVNVNLTIYDLNGRAVQTLVNEIQPAGSYQARWDAPNMASGLYIACIHVTGRQNEILSQRLLLVK
jgi:hypothetical protein